MSTTERHIMHGSATVDWHRSHDHHSKTKTKRRSMMFRRKTGTGRSLILGFLLGLIAALFVSFVFINHHS